MTENRGRAQQIDQVWRPSLASESGVLGSFWGLSSASEVWSLRLNLDRLDRLDPLDRLDRLDRPDRLDRLDRLEPECDSGAWTPGARSEVLRIGLNCKQNAAA